MDRNTFLMKIDYPNHEIYGNVDRFFVPPIDFGTIEKTFREKRVIFLLGPHGSGKTFMAVKLLWNLFQDGIDPVWVKWGMVDVDQVRWKFFSNPQSFLVENTCTYIEDPFGKVQYGRDQWFNKHELLNLVDFFARGFDEKANTYLILTSSLEIYKEFEAILWPEDIAFLKANANFFTINYQVQDYREMLARWATYFACPWMQLDGRANDVFRILQDHAGAVSPLALKDVAFFSRHAADISIPATLLGAQVSNPLGVAARGISMLPWQQKAFLARFFISPGIEKKRAETCLYAFSASIHEQRSIPDKKREVSFDDLVTEFKDVFINEFGGILELTTPGHFEVLDVLLDDCPEFASIINQWVSFLARHKGGIPNLLWTVVRHYSKLQPESQRVVLEFHPGNAEGDGDDLAIPILMNYDHLPPIVQDLLLPQVNDLCVRSQGEDVRSAYQTSLALDRKFPSLPTSVREALLVTLINNPRASEAAWITLYYHDLLSPEARQLPFKLIHDRGELARHLAFGIGFLFHKLPGNIQALAWNAAAGEKDVQMMLASGLFRNLHNLTPEARSLLVELAERDMLEAKLMYCPRSEWSRIPAEDLESLLRAASQKAKAIPAVATFIITNYKFLPESTRSLLFEILDLEFLQKKVEPLPPTRPIPMPQTLWLEISFVIGAILRQAKELPRNVLEILIRLADKPDIARLGQISTNTGFTDLPEDIRKILLEKAARLENIGGSSWYDSFEQHFLSTPPEQQLSILKKLIAIEDPICGFRQSETAFRLLVRNFEALDTEVKAMLVTFARREDARFFFCASVIRGPRPIPRGLIELFLELADTPEKLQSLGHLVIEDYDNLPPALQGLVTRIPIREKTPYKLAESILENYARLPKHVHDLLEMIGQDHPEELAAGILFSYHFAPPEIQERLPLLFERAGDASQLASSLSRAISRKTRERRDTTPPPWKTRPAPRIEVRKSAKRLKEEAVMAALHDKSEKRHEEFEKQHKKFDKKYLPIPKQVERRLLDILVSRGPTEGLVNLLVEHFSVLDPAMTGLLFTWAKVGKVAGALAKAIGRKYEKSPESLKNVLRDLILSPAPDPGVGAALILAYSHLPDDAQRQVFKFAEQESMRGELVLSIALHSKGLPDAVVELLEPLQDALLSRLQEEFKTERGAGWRGMASFIWEETRVPDVRNRVRAMFKDSKDEKVKQWMQLVEKRHTRKAGLSIK